MSERCDVAVGIPAFGGAAYIAEAISSVLAQTGVSVELVVTVDGPLPEIVEACRPFLGDGRVRLVQLPERVGFSGNCNAALSAAAESGADFICLLPDDDALGPRYLAALVKAAKANTKAALVFCDMATFGETNKRMRQPGVSGSPFGRQVSIILDHYSALALRGLVRTIAFHKAAPFPTHADEDFAADVVWLARLALHGDLIRVPRPLYRKRMRPDSTFSGQLTWDDARKVAAWTTHCADLLTQALTVAETQPEARLLRDASLLRLFHGRRGGGPFRDAILAAEPARRAEMEARIEGVFQNRIATLVA